MIIRTIITGILCLLAYLYTLQHNMHMFQLNGYKNNEQRSWLNKNLRQQWTLPWCFVLGIATLFIDFLAWDIWAWINLLLVALEFRALNKLNTKKKFVYTPRVKRMIVTNLLVAVIIISIISVIMGLPGLRGAFIIVVSIQLLMPIVANIINHPIEAAINNYYVNDAKKMIKEVPGLTVIGITGSYGKTSVKFYLQTLLQDYFNVLVTPESYNTPMGVVKTIRGSLKSTHEIFVCEMGARYVGDIKEICDIVHPEHGIISSIGPQHLETFLNMENIQNTKFELADALPKNGKLFLNGDCEYITDKAEGYDNKIFYHSEKVGKGYFAEDIKVSQMGTDFTVVAPDGSKARFQMHLIGKHNVINVVGAIAVANQLGIELEDLKIPVRRLQPVQHRMQLREQGNVTIIDDAYNSNPVGSKVAVETLAMFEGLRVLITPGMVELGTKEEEYNYKFGTYAAECCDYILLVGKKHTEPIKKGAIDKGFEEKRLIVFDKFEEALSYAYAIKNQEHKYILLENDLPDNY